MAMIAVSSDLDIDQAHRDTAAEQWEVWRQGYGLIADVDGVLYVYGVRR